MPSFHPFEVNVPHLAYAFLGGFVVIFGLFSLFIKERLYIGEAVVSTVVGIAIGPYAIGLLDPNAWGGHHEGYNEVANEITLEVTRVVLAIGVFAIGVELPKQYLKKHWRSLAMMIGPGMVYGWLISSLFIWAIIPKVEFLTALAIAACLTPTDPILAQAVVGGKFADKHVPAHIRHLLSAESGSNDGAAFPFLYLALYLIIDNDDRHAVGEWFYITWLYEIALGITIGIIIGYSVRKIMKFSERKGLIDRQSFVAQYVSLSILVIGICTLLGSDDLLAAFACGSAFAWDGFFNKATEDSMFSNVIDLLFNCACFIYIGMVIPFDEFSNVHNSLTVWRLVLLALAILVFRRLPFLLAFYKWIPDVKTLREAAFVGWFGPMGVGAIFISALAREALPEPHEDGPIGQAEMLASTIQPVCFFIVLTSVLCHGLSIPFFSLTKRVHSITHTWSRQSMGDEPAWATHARRINPGESIRINRDDDVNEAADDGTADRGGAALAGEKSNSGEDSTDSGSGGTEFQGGGGERSDVDAMEKGTYRSGDREKQGSDPEVEKAHNEEAGKDGRPHTEDDDRVAEDNGRETPILAEYREGHHLIRERQKHDGSEVEVEVIKDYFHDEKPSQISSFFHPQPLRRREVDKMHKDLPHGADHAADAVRDGGEHQTDRLGLGLMGPKADRENRDEEQEKEEDDAKRQANMRGGSIRDQDDAKKKAKAADEELNREEDRSSDDEGMQGEGAQTRFEEPQPEPAGDGAADMEDGYVDEPEEMESSSPTSSTAPAVKKRTDSVDAPNRARGRQNSSHAQQKSQRPPAIYIHPRPYGRRRESVRHQVFGNKRQNSGSASPASERRDSDLLAPPSPRYGRGRPILNQSDNSSTSTQTTRTGNRDVSPSKPVGLRFAPGTAQSSETAPGPSYYKRSPSGGNPALAMTRTASVQSNASAAAGEEESEEKPKGQTFYNRGSGGSGLQMYKSTSVQSTGSKSGRDEGGFLSRFRGRS